MKKPLKKQMNNGIKFFKYFFSYMKKTLIFSIILIWLLSVNVGNAISILSEYWHNMVDDMLLEFQNLSKVEKLQKSELAWNIYQQAKSLEKYFSKNEISELTGNTKFYDRNLNYVESLSWDKKTNFLKKIRETKYIVSELNRSWQIEGDENFEGYAETILPTPLFYVNRNTVDINRYMGWKWTTWLKLDSSNTIDELWMVLPVKTSVTLIKKVLTWDFVYYEVRNREFDAWTDDVWAFFLDERFVEKKETKTSEHAPILPKKEEIIQNLMDAVWSLYVWWWAYYQWIPEINDLYPTPNDVELSENEQRYKELKWVDCSGLLWQATKGYTPRNTRSILSFGTAVEIEGNSIDEIIEKVEPLDLINWAGHVIIVLDKENAIESIWKADYAGWVEIVNLRERLEDIFTRRQPVNNWNESELPEKEKFVIRRWYK